jgi:predicted phosphodiesterase
MRGRLAVVSDIHGNAAALEAVLAEIDAESCDGVLCLGDTVGYGASPAKCLSSLIALGPQLLVHIRGNHEEALFDAASFNEMNPIARRAILHTATNLEAVHKAWLARIPGLAEFGPVQCIHDNPIPASNTYLRDPSAATAAFRGVGREFCFVGHTHVPLLFETTRGEPDAEPRLDEVVAHLLHEDEPFHLAAGGRRRSSRELRHDRSRRADVHAAARRLRRRRGPIRDARGGTAGPARGPACGRGMRRGGAERARERGS